MPLRHLTNLNLTLSSQTLQDASSENCCWPASATRDEHETVSGNQQQLASGQCTGICRQLAVVPSTLTKRQICVGVHCSCMQIPTAERDILAFLQTRAEPVGTGLFSPLNTVHVQYRGMFIEQFKCKCYLCGGGLKEASAMSHCSAAISPICFASDHDTPSNQVLCCSCSTWSSHVLGALLRCQLTMSTGLESCPLSWMTTTLDATACACQDASKGSP